MNEHEQSESQSSEPANIATGDIRDLSQSNKQGGPGNVNIFNGTAGTVIQVQGDVENLTL
ncbi:hypothetical protein [Spirillospora sp. CA-294931]|uniref:hypothetical protein n=1 Tax=Spirillospora sp. CA-294931 TaxID=3240042 RepID=UPI003D91B49A